MHKVFKNKAQGCSTPLIWYLTHLFIIYIFQNTSTRTTWLPDGVKPDVAEQNLYVPTVGNVAKKLKVKFF